MEEAPDPEALAVGADASVLIDLVAGRRLDNLRELFGVVAVPALVVAEIVRGTSAFPVSKGILEAFWLRRVMSRLNAKLRQPPWPEILRHPTLRPGTLDDLVVKSAG